MKTKTRRILKGNQTWKIKKFVFNCFLSTQGNVIEGESVFNIVCVFFFQKKIEIEKKVKEESKINFRKRRSAAIAEVM